MHTYTQTIMLNMLIALGATVAVTASAAVAVGLVTWTTEAIMRCKKQAHIFFLFCIWNREGRPSGCEVARLRATLNRIRYMASDEITEIVKLCDDALQPNAEDNRR